jgi:hypothetical protein
MHYFLLAKEDTIVTKANFPSKVPELMASGVIPVMNNAGDIGNYLSHHKDSILYDNCSVEACKDGIYEALHAGQDEIKRMSQEARKTTEDKFNYLHWVDILDDFFS